MISVTVAKNIIQHNVEPMLFRRILLKQAAGLVTTEDIHAPVDIPPFFQSSMDGYAFLFSAWQKEEKLEVNGMVAAGDQRKLVLEPGKAIRIFTGAALPAGADTVVMQEKTKLEDGKLIIEDELLKQGSNVRSEGAEIRQGQLALPKGTILTPAAIGFLASLGITALAVHPRPTVNIIVTGDELQEPGTRLLHGQVYESNSLTLKAALQQIGIHDVTVLKAKDDLLLLTKVLKEALEQSDMVLLTGGISVGDYDHVLQATVNNGVQKLFHKIKQRPAKPLYFGKKDDKYVFGLPGNPASGLMAFYEYVIPALGIMNNTGYQLQVVTAALLHPFKKAAGLTHFLKGYYDGKTADVLDAQESFRLSSFARANCLVRIDENVTECRKGEMVEIHLLPGNHIFHG